MTHRCGYVAIVGRPNAGKSTFLNGVLGTKVSITSDKAQTTRNRVVGILNEEDHQLILVDTPGWHEAWSRLNKAMVREVDHALAEVDVVLLMVDLVPAVESLQRDGKLLSKADELLLARCAETKLPVVLGLNKIDLVDPAFALPIIDAWRDLHEFAAIVPLSALKGKGSDALIGECLNLLGEHPPYFPKDQLMDNSEKFVVSEIIREKLFHNLSQELPYSVAVKVEQFDESERDLNKKPKVAIHATILVERNSQKGIVIGKGGTMLKRIGTQARHDIGRLLGCRVRLDLHVKVQKDWTRSDRILRELGLEAGKDIEQ
ncbi:MAG: GTPase Era [Proteobacteria bacterium]|nr:GTPase Era [Pseudomonadota bacterium]MCP4915747.1 GTPase Era [Pseudomonadota bacterium]